MEIPSPAIPLTKKQKDSAAFGMSPFSTMLRSDIAHCIYRVPPPPVTTNTSHLAAKHPLHVPVYLRSTKLPVPKPNAAIRITELLTELGINTQKLVMPTRTNLEIFERVLVAAGGLVDMKRQVDRVEQEMRTLRAQREGFVPPLSGRKVSHSTKTCLMVFRLGQSRLLPRTPRRRIGEAVRDNAMHLHRHRTSARLGGEAV